MQWRIRSRKTHRTLDPSMKINPERMKRVDIMVRCALYLFIAYYQIHKHINKSVVNINIVNVYIIIYFIKKKGWWWGNWWEIF